MAGNTGTPKSNKQKASELKNKRAKKRNGEKTGLDPRQKNTPQAVIGKSFGAKTH